jgi:capsular exopolysaccharide synthesis family protein
VLGAAGPGGTPPQVVLVAGPEVSTGKSLVAANLAVVSAQAGRRTLLLDADLRRPAVQSYLGLGDGPPLGEGPEGANVVYWNTAVPGLFAVTAREPAERPEALWSPEQAANLLAHVREAFDLVVVDAPAALVAADAAVLAPHCDAALLVSESGRTDADALAQVAAELAAAGLRQIGAVLNKFEARHAVGYRTTVGYRHATRYTAARGGRAPA